MRVTCRPPSASSAVRVVCAVLACIAAAGAAAAAAAAGIDTGAIFTCTDDNGRRLTADRPIPECAGKEQRVLNRDGSLRTVLQPAMTADERAAAEAHERKQAEARAAQADAVRRDKNLLLRYKNAEAHARAREAALETVRKAMRGTEQRLAELARERKPLQEEAEFYKGRVPPAELKQKLDAIDAATEAQRMSAQNQKAELERITAQYDVELERLRHLWAGAAPGSLGPMAIRSATATASAASPPARP